MSYHNQNLPHHHPHGGGQPASRGCLGGLFQRLVGFMTGFGVLLIVGCAWAYTYLLPDGQFSLPELTLPESLFGGDDEEDWDGTRPLVCDDDDELHIEGIEATLTDSPAIYATGNCKLVLKDVTVRAPVALETYGKARVTVRGCTLSGSETGIEAGGHSTVILEGGWVSGEDWSIVANQRSKVTVGRARVTGETKVRGRGASIE